MRAHEWPHGRLDEDAPRYASVAKAVAQELELAMATPASLERSVARRFADVVAGTAWPRLRDLWDLQDVTGVNVLARALQRCDESVL